MHVPPTLGAPHVRQPSGPTVTLTQRERDTGVTLTLGAASRRPNYGHIYPFPDPRTTHQGLFEGSGVTHKRSCPAPRPFITDGSQRRGVRLADSAHRPVSRATEP
ncbi:hypothetical protein ACE1SV_64320 [Streptomyces sp. E-15]